MFCIFFKRLGRPCLEHANCVWCPFLQDKIRLKYVQRRASKLASSISKLPYETRLHYENVETLAYRRMKGYKSIK